MGADWKVSLSFVCCVTLLVGLMAGCRAVGTPVTVLTPEGTPLETIVPVVDTVSNAGAPGVSILLAAPGAPGRLYAVVTPGGYDLSIPTDQARLLYSDDDAVSWQSWPGGLPVEPACLNGMNLNYGTPDALYASTCQGIFVWENGAWVKRSDQVTNVIAVVHGQPEQIWAAVPWNGIIRSDDGGKSWRDASGGLMSFGGILALAVDPDDAHVRYAIIRPQYAGSYLRRSVGADEWQTMPTPEENSTIDTGMVLEGSTGSLYLTSQLAPAKIWRSDNPKAPAMENIAWQQVGTFGDANARLLASGWASQGLALYATVTPYNRQPDGSGIPGAPMLQRSVDGGRTWEVLAMP